MYNLNQIEIHNISLEIATFMYQLHNIDFNSMEVFETNDISLNLIDFLNELITTHISEQNKVFWKYNEFSKKNNNTLVHGDLNSSNILLDENNHIAGIIDFGFGGFGNPYFDIARIIGRTPEYFKKEIIENYEKISNLTLDTNLLDNEIDIWKNIDNSYIEYMKSIGIYK